MDEHRRRNDLDTTTTTKIIQKNMKNQKRQFGESFNF